MKRVALWFVVMWVVSFPCAASAAQMAAIARPGDRVTVTVEGQPGVSRQYVVEGDGMLTLPLIGRVKAAGLTDEALEADLRRRFDVYFKDPRVHVSIERPKRVFVFGAVKSPGTYEIPATGFTIMELLVRAQYSGVSEVLVVRTKGAVGPVLPEQAAPADVVRVNLRDLEKAIASGDLTRNLRLEPGDTIFVPETDPNLVHTAGEVRNAASFSVPDGTTVRQVLALAGGPTERGAIHRLRVLRIEDGEQRSRAADLDEPVKPGDTIVVPEVFSLPGVPIPPGILRTSEPRRSSIRLGHAVALTPIVSFTQFGVDTNVLKEPDDPKTAFVAEVSPQLQASLDLPRVQLEGASSVGLAYYTRGESDRSASPRHDVSGRFTFGSHAALTGGFGTGYIRERFTAELDARVRRHERNATVGIELGPWRRLKLEASWTDMRRRFPHGSFPTLTENQRAVNAKAQFAVSPLTSLFLSGTADTRSYPLRPGRNADFTVARLGAEFKRRALVEGQAYVALMRYQAIEESVPDADTFGTGVMLWHTWRDRTQIGARVERTIGSTIHEQYPYAVTIGYGGWIQSRLSRRFDFIVETFTDRYKYRQFRTADEVRSLLVAQEDTVRYAAQFGVSVLGTRVALEVSQLQRLGRGHVVRTRDYTGWRANILIDASYRFLHMRRNEGTSIRGRNGFRTY